MRQTHLLPDWTDRCKKTALAQEPRLSIAAPCHQNDEQQRAVQALSELSKGYTPNIQRPVEPVQFLTLACLAIALPCFWGCFREAALE